MKSKFSLREIRNSKPKREIVNKPKFVKDSFPLVPSKEVNPSMIIAVYMGL